MLEFRNKLFDFLKIYFKESQMKEMLEIEKGKSYRLVYLYIHENTTPEIKKNPEFDKLMEDFWWGCAN